MLGCSLLYLSIQCIRRTVKIKPLGYLPVDRIDQPGEPNRNGEDQESDPLVLHQTVSRTSEPPVKISRPKGELPLLCLELVALIGKVTVYLIALVAKAWDPNWTVPAIAGLVTWGCVSLLATSRLVIRKSSPNQASRLWNQSAALYTAQWIPTILLFRSAVIHPISKLSHNLRIVDFVLGSILALIAITSRPGKRTVELEYENDLKPSQEPLASFLSHATFSWVDGIVWQGYQKTMEIGDVWNLAAKDKAMNVIASFRHLQKTSKLAFHLLKYFKHGLILQAIYSVISGFLVFAPTLLLKAFLEFIENPEETPVNAAWFYIILIGLSTTVNAALQGLALWEGRKISIHLRAILIGEIYAKALRRKAAASSDTDLGADKKSANETPSAKQSLLAKFTLFGRKKDKTGKLNAVVEVKKKENDSQVNVGTIINLMAVDTFKVGEISAYLHFLWGATPVQLITSVVLLYRILGWSAIASIVLMVMVTPLNLFIAKQFTKRQRALMAATDKRIHSTNEVLQNIRIIKYFAWEERYSHIINEKRRVELRALRNRYILWTFAATVWFGLPLLITFFSFLLYTVVEKRPLIPSIAFTALSLFTILKYPLDQLADMIAHVQESKVSIDRVEGFLNEDETDKYQQLLPERKNSSSESLIGFEKATFSWGGKDARNTDGSTAFRMIDMNIKFDVGQLNVVAGPTGSGKTSLLMALLGEMALLQGSVHLPGGECWEDLRPDPETGLTESVAYCAQQAWLVNGTIKENILFASPWDEHRYKLVLEACALERDLEILDQGDSTLVGEKGVALSGGQKQRISLARALYCTSRHVLLDDCLSAVDSHTAKHLFRHCIRGPLMTNRTCILVTHNIVLCVPEAQHVVVLANGKIAAQGNPEQVMSTGLLGDEMSKPSSKAGTRIHSRVQSTTQLEDAAGKDMNGKANGHAVEEATESKKPDGKEAHGNAMKEAKAEGGVKVQVIKMYLDAMGHWWFWIFALTIFAAQQVGSVAANVWIRQWANAYPLSESSVSSMTLESYPKASLSFQYVPHNLYFWRFPAASHSNGQPPIISRMWNQTPMSVQHKVDVSYYLTGYALLALVYLVVCFVREALIFWGSLRASWNIHSRLLRSVTRAKFRFFDSTPLGQIMNRFSKDIEGVDQEVAPTAVSLLSCVASIVSIIILITVITPGFLIAGIFISAIYFTIGKFYISSSRDLKRLESVLRSPLYQQLGETLSGVTTIRAYGHQRRFLRDNQSRIDAVNRPFIYLWACNRWLSFRTDTAGGLVSFFAGVFVILSYGKVDAGAAGLSLTYGVMFADKVLWLVLLYSVNEQNMNSVERVKEYLDIDQEAQAIIPETRPPGDWPSRGAVQFIGYSTRYRPDLEPVLRGVTFNILPGERVGIVGRTGAGKSSLALALFRGLEAEAGKILIDDVDIGLIGLQDLREAITIVPQDPTLFTGTLRSNLDPFGLFTDEEIFDTLRRVQLIDPAPSASSSTPNTPAPVTTLTPPDSPESIEEDDGLDLQKKLTNTRENANIFGNLSSSIAESGSNISQGQRQLLCLARALLKAPRVLLMDEATASIDYATDSKIQETLREVRGSTIITIAHRLQTIVDYDKVLVLDKGEVIEFDSPWELLSRGGIFHGMCEMSGDFDILFAAAKEAQEKKNLVEL